ncbi:DUF1380 family protein [Enterobacter hormaechei]|jgi:hypothetical protein|uniref:DUF1380 family protein n=1 Tax=Enterobacter hormaechei TaxID=158836 RepID=UPI000DE75FF4|nr:DUF1380 family protein [Enterobacter hormaechei]EAA1242937.1 hypothetical protein [Salmonella enterica subsp. enterica serovar Mbandaka]EDM4432477.1 hypothetical protein [Salmonella enterica subsp. enterica serovar Infantis]HEG2123476.1 DUF1380 family protein [Enterobacter kobei]SSI88369.1 Uncharacterised protein [Enterobacter hormaechei]HCT6418831.1 DUF1380 family protein [Enterobacter hormaechei]
MFGTAKEITEKLENYPEDEPLLMVMWHKEDVSQVRPDLTDEQCVQVMRKIKDCHDANVGVNWDVISDTAETLFPKEKSSC